MNKTVGFIGLGVMGKPMAKNLVKAGFPLVVYDVAKEPVSELAKLGATAAGSCQEVAKSSDVTIIMVADTSQVRDVIFGDTGVLNGLQPGKTVIIMSTTEPALVKSISQTMGEKGVKVIDAPVVRGKSAAEAGTLGIFVGGDPKVMEDCRPILQAMGKDIYYCGNIGNGEVLKIVNNYIVIGTSLLLAEAVVMGVKSGVKADRLLELLGNASANSWILQAWGPKVLSRDFKTPLFELDLALKDVALGVTTAKDLKIPVPLGALCEQIIRAESASGKGKWDFTSPITRIEELAGIEVKSEK